MLKSTRALDGHQTRNRYAPSPDGSKAIPIETITVVHDKNAGRGGSAMSSQSRPTPRPRLASALPAADPAAVAEAVSLLSGDGEENAEGEQEERSPFAHLKQTEYNFGVQQISKNGRQVRH